jgi:hypothetical protein
VRQHRGKSIAEVGTSLLNDAEASHIVLIVKEILLFNHLQENLTSHMNASEASKMPEQNFRR